MDPNVRFNFGKNWNNYSSKIDQSKLNDAIISLEKLLPSEIDFSKKKFLDIGCGSGIHAISAKKLGFKSVLCTDYDIDSVNTSRRNIDKFKSKIKVIQDDILKTNIQENFDIVYSWGVLHHTGNMKKAINNTKKLVMPKGYLIIAIYRKTYFCPLWTNIKYFYCRTNNFNKFILEKLFYSILIIRHIVSLNFSIFEKNERGMNLYNDSVDWLGGYPYESATIEEILDIVGEDFNLINSFNTKPGYGIFGTGCAEYIFRKN